MNRRSCGTSTDADAVHAATSMKQQLYEATSDISKEIIDAIIKRHSRSESTAEVPSAIAEDVPSEANETLSDESKAKASLAEQLLNLSKYGWYWGPISADQADAKLLSEPDGAFLVRDSSDDR